MASDCCVTVDCFEQGHSKEPVTPEFQVLFLQLEGWDSALCHGPTAPVALHPIKDMHNLHEFVVLLEISRKYADPNITVGGPQQKSLHVWKPPTEPLSKLRVYPLVTTMILPYIPPPFKEFRL